MVGVTSALGRQIRFMGKPSYLLGRWECYCVGLA